jgi:hypothetical protein
MKMIMKMKKQKWKKKKRKNNKKKKDQNWIRPAPRASGLRPLLGSVGFPPHIRSIK